MLDEIEFASEKGSIGKMTGIQKLMMACFVIGLFFIGLSLSAFSADRGEVSV